MTPSTSNNQLSIYPIEVTIDANGVPHKGNILKINELGMILEVFASVFNPQQHLILKWVLPVDNIAMEEEVIVIKKYTQNRSGTIIYLMEVHYKNIKHSNASAILTLLGRTHDGKIPTGKLSDDLTDSTEKPTDPAVKKNKP